MAILFIPVWTALSKKIGKKWCYSIGLLEEAAILVIIFAFGPTLPLTTLFILIGLCGIGFSTGYALPWSIIPDTIDLDYVKTEENREGAYYGIWTFSSKLGQGLSALLIGWLLTLTHYDGKVVIQNADAQTIIRLLFGPIGAIFYVAAAVVVMFYPITAKKHAEIRKQIDALNAAKLGRPSTS